MASELGELSQSVLDGTLTIAEVLNQLEVSYALVGGIAAGYRTHPRATRDVDLLLDVPQIVLPGLLEQLEKRNFEFDLQTTIREWTQHHMVVLSYQGIRVDWLKPVIPAYQHILDHATEETWLGQRIRVASAEGLILMKLLAGRGQDWVDIENLVAAKGDGLDIEWILGEWQTLADASDPRMVRLLELVDQVQQRITAGEEKPDAE